MSFTKAYMLIVFLLVGIVPSQAQTFDDYIQRGVEYHDLGSYAMAVDQYLMAYKLNPESGMVNYQLCISYYHLGNYEKSLKFAQHVIDLDDEEHLEGAYIMKGSALDMMDKPQSAINHYREALKRYPKSFLIHYNLAYTAFDIGDYQLSTDHLQKALRIRAIHPNSHNLLGQIHYNNSPIKSILAFSYYLLIDPKEKNSLAILALLVDQLEDGKNMKTGPLYAANVNYQDKDPYFKQLEKALDLIQESLDKEEQLESQGVALFAENLNMFYLMIGEAMPEDDSGFWWDFYVDFFYEMAQAGHAKTFAYYISQSNHDAEAASWMIENEESLVQLIGWIDNYYQYKGIRKKK